MKLNLFAALIAGAMLCLAPGEISAPAQTTPISSNTPSGPVQLSGQDLQQLVAPIALYPDPLLALILQGSTVPTDIVLASRWLADGNSADNIDAQPWDDSVKGLARYPDVLQMMDENLDWTNQLGAAVLAQQADVMTAVQAMRAKAQTLGNLETTAQQQVIDQDNVIQIVRPTRRLFTFRPTIPQSSIISPRRRSSSAPRSPSASGSAAGATGTATGSIAAASIGPATAGAIGPAMVLSGGPIRNGLRRGRPIGRESRATCLAGVRRPVEAGRVSPASPARRTTGPVSREIQATVPEVPAIARVNPVIVPEFRRTVPTARPIRPASRGIVRARRAIALATARRSSP